LAELELAKISANTLRMKRHKALVDFLVAKREAAGMSQSALAERLKKSQTYVVSLESGRRRVSVVELLKLAEILGFDPAEVISNLKKIAP
jgi:transcriptional regulator with XRE-family HTH domain